MCSFAEPESQLTASLRQLEQARSEVDWVRKRVKLRCDLTGRIVILTALQKLSRSRLRAASGVLASMIARSKAEAGALGQETLDYSRVALGLAKEVSPDCSATVYESQVRNWIEN
ncbi:hypothetical protein AK812_SmicGene29506 [Symbiodinium microadriaticum]|uniref:Uncharacterized protein n=1 Tax=Symbiodinium microadriaticum TaxID=2951 RepID=A0A1Q9D1N3_SYMMI|nr:hypothetical protein AK812_SmicGene29506 [Symbiodinium microadriaticum]